MNKKSFFWVSYADLMSSLFFIMLVLFVLMIVMFHKEDPERLREEIRKLEKELVTSKEELAASRIELAASKGELDKIREIQNAVSKIDPTFFEYNPDHKKHVLKIDVEFPTGDAEIENIPIDTRWELLNAGKAIEHFIEQALEIDPATQYLLIIEGQASRDDFAGNNELSYRRALVLRSYWKQNGLELSSDHCEVIVAGSGQEGTLRVQPDNATNKRNQRFLIHILPKPGIIK